MKIDVSARRAHERPTCVYCRDEVGPSDALGLCPACGVTFHEPCRTELTRCPTPGCVGLDEAAFAARQRADEDAERDARRAAARARREVEDRGEPVPAPRPRRSAAAQLEPDEPPALEERSRVWRATSGAELGACAVVGALVGGVVGLALAYVTARHGITADTFFRYVPTCVAVAAFEATIVGGVGVRRSASDPTLTTLGAVAAATCMAAMAANDLGAPPLAGALAGLLVGLPLALRFSGVR